MFNELITAIEISDLSRARTQVDSLLSDGHEPWEIHESLFPLVLRVVNPPFINPHLPKMYAINREFVQFLQPAEIASLLRVEMEEYTRREKVAPHVKSSLVSSIVDFNDIESAIASKSVSTTAATMAAFLGLAGPEMLARRLLILGSGYLDGSLGHSLSCTAFILMEMITRKDVDAWPSLVLLSDYFCTSNFQKTPKLHYSAISDYSEVYLENLRRAISGTGIVALHHTLTLYAIERSRHFLNRKEYDHVLTMWEQMLSNKEENLHPMEMFADQPLPDFNQFLKTFRQRSPRSVLSLVNGALSSESGRKRLKNYLIRSILNCYDGKYNPHYLTGLGASLWVMETYHDTPIIVLNALWQYLDYFYSGTS